MDKNSFKELEILNIKKRKDNGDEVKKNLGANIHLFNFVSNLIDLYIPKVGNVIQSFGENTKSGPNKNNHSN